MKHLNDQRFTTPWQQKALTKLLGLNYKIQYKKGTDNRVADALSRVEHSSSTQLNATSVVQPTWLSKLQNAYLQDEVATKLLSELSISSPVGHYKMKDGLIYYNDRIWTGNTHSIQAKVYCHCLLMLLGVILDMRSLIIELRNCLAGLT